MTSSFYEPLFTRLQGYSNSWPWDYFSINESSLLVYVKNFTTHPSVVVACSLCVTLLSWYVRWCYGQRVLVAHLSRFQDMRLLIVCNPSVRSPKSFHSNLCRPMTRRCYKPSQWVHVYTESWTGKVIENNMIVDFPSLGARQVNSFLNQSIKK